MATIDVLIPTCQRKTGLAVVLASLLNQTFTDFDVVISDQTREEERYLESIEIQTSLKALEWRGHRVQTHHHLPRRGMAEQRHFLLDCSTAPFAHFLDDDVLLETDVIQRMYDILTHEQCGFVGAAATGVEYLDDVRPHETRIEVWNGPVEPEPFSPDWLPWERHTINNAANPLHLEQQLCSDGHPVRYKIAWVGGANVLYDRAKLDAVGGFRFWDRLPPGHAGEEVVVQFLLIRGFGGCGVLPSGTYHLGLPTTISDRESNAVDLFADLIAEQEAAARP
jgi:GT2 family glycosyltransferase